MNWTAIIWLVLMLIFIAVEAGTVAMVSAWFAAGALAALSVSLLGGEAWLQIVVFFGVSAVMLLLLRPIAKKHFTPKLIKTNVDRVIEEQGLVTEEIDNIHARGQVKLGAMYWTARSTNNEVLAAGTQIRVDRIEGVKVFVSPVCEPAETKN